MEEEEEDEDKEEDEGKGEVEDKVEDKGEDQEDTNMSMLWILIMLIWIWIRIRISVCSGSRTHKFQNQKVKCGWSKHFSQTYFKQNKVTANLKKEFVGFCVKVYICHGKTACVVITVFTPDPDFENPH